LDAAKTVPIFGLNIFRNPNKEIKKESKDEKREVLTIKDLISELGVAREGVITSYDAEENPDVLGPQTYIEMQRNDGEVQAIVRLLSLPIKATPFHILPAKGDKGERDFIDTNLNSPPEKGGMTTPLAFIIADMTRAIFEGFRLYEKVAKIIEEGPYKGFVAWRKLAPRDAQTITLEADEHGGFKGARQRAVFGQNSVDVDIPAGKCMLYTFQKEKHWLYGESILKTAYYHYDKKHKLYYIAHKKAEIEALGLKILKIGQTLTQTEREAAEEVVDTIGINSRITLPPGVELEIERGGGGYDPLPLIQHHDEQMSKSALTQVLDQVKYAYPYGRGTPSSQYLIIALESIMQEMAATINTYAIAPLIDFNYSSKVYPYLQFEKLSDASQIFLREVFDRLMRAKVPLPEGFVEQVVDETAKNLNLAWVRNQKNEEEKGNRQALESFEKGKLKKANELEIRAPSTPFKLKEKLLKVRSEPDLLEKCYKLGEEFVYVRGNSGDTKGKGN